MRVFWGQVDHENPEGKIEGFQEVGGNAGKVLVSPRNEALEKANEFLGALVLLYKPYSVLRVRAYRVRGNCFETLGRLAGDRSSKENIKWRR